MDINFITIDDKTIQAAMQLCVHPTQQDFVESVAISYEEAKQRPFWHPVMIEIDHKKVGFAMYGLYEEEGIIAQLWIDRFFIDYHFQQKGYAKISMLALIEKVKQDFTEQPIYLSVYEDNCVAIHLYETLGFRFNGELDLNGEKVMVLQ